MLNVENSKQKKGNSIERLSIASRARSSARGFSLIELMVAVALFAVIMMVAVGALLSLVDANRKARSLQSVMNNLNISLDSMVRSIRMGSAYNCGATAIPSQTTGADCPNGSTSISFSPFGANPTIQSQRWEYSFVPPSGGNGGRIYRSTIDGGITDVPITAPEISIDSMTFYVVGTVRGNTPSLDTVQPRVVMVVKGTAGQDVGTRTTFYIQSTAVQRILDL